jgi:Fe-S-cluster containining protein
VELPQDLPQRLPELGPLSIYFTFPDGALSYHCEECGYRCCRGAGFGATRTELVQLRARYPRLGMFLSPQREPEQALLGLQNFSPRCFFLADDGRCRVEVEHGRALKPYICRTFPANQVSRFGDSLIIDVNLLCPLRPTQPGDMQVRHADVIADLQQSLEVPMLMPAEAEERFPLALLQHERFLRDLPADDDLLARLALADLMAPRWAREPRPPSAAFVAPHREYLVGLRREMIALLGLSDALDPARPRFVRELSLMLPRLRLALLRMRPAEVAIEALLPQLGRRLLAIGLYVELIAHLGGEIALGTIDHAFRNGQLFCELLAQADRIPLLVPGDDSYQLTLYRTQEAAMQRFLHFLHDENPRRRLSLREVLAEIGLADPAERAQLLQSFTAEAMPRFRFEARG